MEYLKRIFALKWQLLAAKNACNEFRKVEFAYKSCHFPEQTGTKKSFRRLKLKMLVTTILFLIES